MTATKALNADAVAQTEDRGGPAQPLLMAQNLTKHFPIRSGLLNRRTGTVHAVDDVSFHVKKGDAWHRR